MTGLLMKRDTDERDSSEGGATIGNRPEFSSETIPGGVHDDDERVAANSSQSSGEGKATDRVQGGGNESPHGHREAET
jgi:hypothetical protein